MTTIVAATNRPLSVPAAVVSALPPSAIWAAASTAAAMMATIGMRSASSRERHSAVASVADWISSSTPRVHGSSGADAVNRNDRTISASTPR